MWSVQCFDGPLSASERGFHVDGIYVAVFTACRNAGIAGAVLATAVPSVCPSVCLSHASIV